MMHQYVRKEGVTGMKLGTLSHCDATLLPDLAKLDLLFSLL